MPYDKSAIRNGMYVYSSDGSRLGRVIRVDSEGFVVEKGMFFPKDYEVSFSDVSDIRDDAIHLSMDEASFKRGEGHAGEISEDGDRAAATTEREARIPVSEERVEPVKTRKETGDVRVRKEVTTEEQTMKVPVTREEVHVERVPAEPGRSAEAEIGEEEVVIPTHEEEVEVHKRPVVKEEVRVKKEEHRGEETLREPVRKEHVEVEETEAERRAREEEEAWEERPRPQP